MLNNIRLTKTSEAYPEQYNAFFGSKQIGYIKLEYGLLVASYPHSCGKMVYNIYFANRAKGKFIDDQERNKYLDDIKVALLNAHKKV